MILRKYQINSTLRFYATLSALQLLCFNKNPDDGGDTWNTNNTNTNETNFLQHTSENIFIDLFPEQLASLSAIIRNQNDMNMRKILEESTFQSWQSHLARKSLLEDLIRFDRNDNDRRITLYPLDIRNETKTETKTNTTTSTIQVHEAASISNDSVSLNSYFDSHSDSDRPFSLFQLPNDTRNFDSLAAYGLDERKPSASFGEFLTQDVFLDNSFYDLHLNTISSSFPSTSTSSSSSSSASTSTSSSSSSSSAYGKSKRNPLKKDAVLPNINRIRRQDIDFFDRFIRDSNETTFAPQLLEIKKEEPEDEEEAAAAAVMREQETLAMMTTSIYKQDVDLGYTFSNYNPSYTILSPPMEDVEKVEVIQNLNDTKIADSNEHGIDIGYLLSLSSSTAANLSGSNKTNDSAQQKLLKIEEDRRLAEILYEQDIDLGYILSTEDSKESSSSKKSSDKPVDKKNIDKEDSNDVSDLWAGIPFKIDNETGEYIRLPFEEILKDLIPMEDENGPKDEETKVEEPTSPLDLDATIEDIANLLTPPSEFYGVQSGQAVAPPPPPLYNSHNPNLCYQPQHGQVYSGYNENNVSVGGYYEANMDQAGTSLSSNALYAASGGNQEEALHSDAYLDSILKMMDANETHNSKQSGNQIDNSNSNDSGGAKNSNKAPENSSVGQGNVQNFLDLSCGSAGSSLGSLSSESLPSNSDGEWGDGSDHGNDYQRSNFYGPYDYSSNNSSNFTSASTAAIRQVPVAQKKYHMFGKRFLQEEKISNNTLTDSTRINTLQSENPVRDLEGKENSTFDDEFDEEMKVHANLKNISTVIKPGVKTDPDKLRTSDEIVVRHNHTYAMSHSSDSNSALDHDGSEYGDIQSEEGHLTRDEKRARNLNIPIPVYDIINLPMDEFNERVSKYDLSENQLSLIRDIRRRGKNKVAAQNCRKRKLDTILTLETEVEKVRRRKEELHNEKVYVAMEKKRIASKFAALHKHIFHYLKDEDGKPCSPSKYSFQQSPNGSMFLTPRANSKQDPNCYGMELLMGGPSTSSACRDRSRLKDSVVANGRRTKPDEKESITEL